MGWGEEEVPQHLQEDIWDTVRTAVAEMFYVDPGALSPDTVLKDLGAQSFDFVDLVVRLESSFNVGIPRELTIPGDQTLQSYIAAVASRLDAKDESA